jgi:hypothetical protein
LLFSEYVRNGIVEYYVSDYIGIETDIIVPSFKNGIKVTGIGNAAFQSKNITSVIFPDTIITIGINAFSKNQITSLTLPNSVYLIGNSAFRVNPLTSLSLGNSLTIIEAYAFQNNNLTSVTIPNSVTTIGEAAFSSTQPLTIYVETTLKPQAWSENWYIVNETPVTVIWDHKNN